MKLGKSTLGFAGACVVLVALASQVRADWPMRRHDPQRTAMTAGASNITAPVPRWRTYLGGSLGAYQYVAKDVNGHGRAEVIFVAGGRIIAKDPSYDMIVWETDLLELYSIERIADLDSDGSVEIVAKSFAGLVYILAAADGSVLWSSPEGFLGNVGAIRFVDVDGDGLRDMYVTDVACGSTDARPQAAAIYSFASGVAQTEEHCRLEQGVRDYYCGHHDVLLDVDGDGEIEVLALGVRHLYAYHTQEDQLTVDAEGHRICPLEYESENIDNIPYGLALTDFADVDSDGRPEVFCYANNNYGPTVNSRRLFVIEYDPAVPGLVRRWQHSVADVSNDRHSFHSDSLADLESDGRFEVATSFYDFASDAWTVMVLDAASGDIIETLEGYRLTGMTDLDQDGEPEVVTDCDGDLVAFDFVNDELLQLWLAPDCRAVDMFDPDHRLDRSAAYRTLIMDLDSNGPMELIVLQDKTALHALDASNGNRKFTYPVPAQTQILTWEVFPDVTLAGDQVLTARSDGYLVVLGHALEPTNQYEWEEFIVPGMRTGGYYTGWRGFGGVPVAGDIDADGVDDVVVPDSRGVLLWLDSTSASWTEPPQVVWSLATAQFPLLVPWDSDGELELVLANYSYTDDGNIESSIEVYDFGEDVPLLWSTPIGRAHLDPLPMDVDGDGDLDVFFGGYNTSGGTGYHNVLRHEDGARMWAQDYEEVVAGSGFHFNAAVEVDGDGLVDVLSGMRNNIKAFRGQDGTVLATVAASYGGPMIFDLDNDGSDEVLTTGPYSYQHMFEVDPAASPPLQEAWIAVEAKFHSKVLGAIAECSDGVRHVHGRYRSPGLALREAVTGTVIAEPILAGGQMYATEEEAVAAGHRPGFLGNTTVHTNLTGDGPAALVGSTDGHLYAVEPCTGQLVWAHNFRYPVGEAILADTNGDGFDEILVSVADGYLYELGREVLPAPAHVFDSDCEDHAGSINDDIDEVESSGTLCAGWDSVTGATGYVYTIVSEGGNIIIGGDRPDWLETSETCAAVPFLPVQVGHRYFFVVMARGDEGMSVQNMSDGVTVVDTSSPTVEVTVSERVIYPDHSPATTTIWVSASDTVGLKSGETVVLDGNGETILELGSWTTEEPTYYRTHTWNGRDTSGTTVPAGRYIIRATARDLQDREASDHAEVDVSYDLNDGGLTDGGDGGGGTAGCGCGSIRDLNGPGGWSGCSGVLLVVGLALLIRLLPMKSRSQSREKS